MPVERLHRKRRRYRTRARDRFGQVLEPAACESCWWNAGFRANACRVPDLRAPRGSPSASVIDRRPLGRSTRAASLIEAIGSPTSPSAVTIITTSKVWSPKGSLRASPQAQAKLIIPRDLIRAVAKSSMGGWTSNRIRRPDERLLAMTGLKYPGPQPTSRTWSVLESSSRSAMRPGGVTKCRSGLNNQLAYSTG